MLARHMISCWYVRVHRGDTRVVLVDDVVWLVWDVCRALNHVHVGVLAVKLVNFGRDTLSLSNLVVHTVRCHLLSKVAKRGRSVHGMTVSHSGMDDGAWH